MGENNIIIIIKGIDKGKKRIYVKDKILTDPPWFITYKSSSGAILPFLYFLLNSTNLKDRL